MPDKNIFVDDAPPIPVAEEEKKLVPGEYFIDEDTTLTINEGREAVTIQVTNRGDRPVQIGSHYHFYEINPGVEFDRDEGYGRRLDIPSGTAVRLEPGDSRSVDLIDYEGRRYVYGFHDKVNGPLK